MITKPLGNSLFLRNPLEKGSQAMRTALLVCLALVLPNKAFADDFTPAIDEVSGNWLAVSFMDGPRTKVCAAGSIDHKLTFRADENDIEFRSSNDSWSLSADATGDAVVKVGTVEKTFHMQTLDATTLVSVVKPDDLENLLDAMDKAPTALLTFGNKKAVSVSLGGSTRALNSFRTCSARHDFGNLGGSVGSNANPF